MCGWFDLRVGERLQERHLLGQRYMRYACTDACADGSTYVGADGGTNNRPDGRAYYCTKCVSYV